MKMPSLSSLVLVLSITFLLVNCPAASIDWQIPATLLRNVTERFFSDMSVYEIVMACFWRLWEYLPEWSYTCPKGAFKVLADEPEGRHFRKNDIEQIKKLFHNMSNTNKRLPVVYIVGVPGSGKTELARQFGESIHCKEHGASTVVTLNCDGHEEFKRSLVRSLEKMYKNTGGGDWIHQETDTTKLMESLKTHLSDLEDGWLLIVDNLKDPYGTQKELYRMLPKPGVSDWGIGKMLVTTQVSLKEINSTYVRIRQNTGMSLRDATDFLRELIEKRTSLSCDVKVAQEIVGNVSYLPLAIVAAGAHIEKNTRNDSYSCRDYLPEFAAFEINPAYANDENDLTKYNGSMLTALNLAISNARKIYSDTFRDFIALIGFTAVNRKEIATELVQGFLKMRRNDSENIDKIFKFPLVYYSRKEDVFRIHQVTGYAFRKELERSETVESLQHIFQDMSEYLLNDRFSWSHHRDLVKNLPKRCPHIHCLISPESQDFSRTLFTIRNLFSSLYDIWDFGNASNCLSWANTFFRLDSPDLVTVRVRFTGYAISYQCLSDFGEKTKAITEKIVELIKEMAPEQSELHRPSVAEFLLRNFDRSKIDLFYYRYLFSALFIPGYWESWNGYPKNYRELRLSLCNIIKILAPHHVKKWNEFCNLTQPKTFSVPLGTSYRLLYYNAEEHVKRWKHYGANPYGACYVPRNQWVISNSYYVPENKWRISSILPGRKLQFYLDHDKRVRAEELKVASRRYEAVLHFLKWVIQAQLSQHR